jgi:DNA-binding response OmpR family regulator
MRLLVVDDELDTAQMIALLLRNAGHEVSYAITAKAALDLAASHRPDVIILDLRLPDMDGIDLARQLKAMDGVRQARIIAITGRMTDAEGRALEAGCERFLRKPLSPELLDAIIREGAAPASTA